jgi:hypothetical protein
MKIKKGTSESVPEKNKKYEQLIAPCGMNCAICSGYLAWKNQTKEKGVKFPYCEGCRTRPRICAWLKKRCDLLLNDKVEFCYECKNFPCDKLEHIDRRYRTHFKTSFLENLETIKKDGIEKLLKNQRKKWRCSGCEGMICCHNGLCFQCDLKKLKNKKKK